MTLTDEATARMRGELVVGIDRSNTRRRRNRRRALVVPVLLVLLGITVAVVGSGNDPAYALATTPDGSIRVEIYPDFDDVDELEAELRDFGLDVTVVQLRGHPSLDGLIEIASHDNQASGAFEIDDGEFVVDVARVEGEVEILVYSTAEDGETYQFAPSIFAMGQPLEGLHCAYTDRPLSTAEFEQRASEVGLNRIEWILFETQALGSEGSEESLRPDGVVTGAQLHDESTLLAIVVPASDQPASETIVMSDGSHSPASAGCNPALAAQWD